MCTARLHAVPQYLHDAGMLLGFADQCILGLAYLRSNLSKKLRWLNHLLAQRDSSITDIRMSCPRFLLLKAMKFASILCTHAGYDCQQSSTLCIAVSSLESQAIVKATFAAFTTVRRSVVAGDKGSLMTRNRYKTNTHIVKPDMFDCDVLAIHLSHLTAAPHPAEQQWVHTRLLLHQALRLERQTPNLTSLGAAAALVCLRLAAWH